MAVASYHRGMDRQAALGEAHEFLVERLGEHVGEQLFELVRPGFALDEVEVGEATGECRFGGRAMLEPGTSWPEVKGFPLSLLAVIDTDALQPWLEGAMPRGVGFLNFFYLDEDSEHADPRAMEIAGDPWFYDHRPGVVVAAAASQAVEAAPPPRASVFEPIAWKATPGLALPDLWWDQDVRAIDLGPEATDLDRAMPGDFIEATIEDWHAFPASIRSEHIAFGWPQAPTGTGPIFPRGEDPRRYHHLLQLPGNDQWRIGGEGGWMHYSIPSEALRAGDITKAIPTPCYW